MENVISSSSISTNLAPHHVVLNYGDTEAITTWVTAGGAKHFGARRSLKLEIDVVLALGQQLHGVGLCAGLQSSRLGHRCGSQTRRSSSSLEDALLGAAWP
jgi:hypothetical protein